MHYSAVDLSAIATGLAAIAWVNWYFFFAGRYVLRFLSRLENDRGLAGFGQKKRGNRKN